MSVFKKLPIALLLVVLLSIVCSPSIDFRLGLIDGKAFLLVLLSPVLVMALIQRKPMPWHLIRGAFGDRSAQITQELLDLTQPLVNGTAAGRLVKMSESHPDPRLRYGAALLMSRFQPQEIRELMARRIEARDTEWNSIQSLCAFLAKMSPYFGMLATVVGLVQLLSRLEDFSKISSGMALAMQGTLFGLVSFTLIYSPLQRFLQSCREEDFDESTLIARWFVLVAQKADPVLIREALLSTQASEKPLEQGMALGEVPRGDS